MKKVQMLVYTSRLDQVIKPGDIIEADDATADFWIKNGIAKAAKTKFEIVKEVRQQRARPAKRTEVTAHEPNSGD